MTFDNLLWWTNPPRQTEPERPISDQIRLLFAASCIVDISALSIGCAIFALWISGWKLTTQNGFSESYASFGVFAFALGIIGLLLGGGWFVISLFFITIEWLAWQFNKIHKINDWYLYQVILIFLIPVILLFITLWLGSHDPHSALCNSNLSGVTCGRVITMSESMGVSP